MSSNPKTFKQTKNQHQTLYQNLNGKHQGDQDLLNQPIEHLQTKVQQLSVNFEESMNNDSEEEINRILNYQQHEGEQQRAQQRLESRDRAIDGKKQPLKGGPQQIFLTLKVDQLEKMCSTLSETNKKLQSRIATLEQSEQNAPFIDEFSEMQNEFGEVQTLIHQYRQHLEGYRQKLSAQIAQKDKIIGQLKQQIKLVVESNASSSELNMELQKQNDQLQMELQKLCSQNEELFLEIESIKQYHQKQKQKQKESQNLKRAESKRNFMEHNSNMGNRRITTQQNRYLNGNQRVEQDYRRQLVFNKFDGPDAMSQDQMEVLIERLVNELQHEKKLKTRMNSQIKRLSNQLLASQRQIMEKNNKIHCFELNAIRNGRTLRISKSTNRLQEYHDDQQHRIPQIKRTLSRNHGQTHAMHSFNLVDLLNKEIYISDVAKVQLARKIVALYEAKLQRKEYSHLVIEELRISNFTENKLELMTVQQMSRGRPESPPVKRSSRDASNQQNLIWNMAYLMDSIFVQVPDSTEAAWKTIKKQFLELIEDILSKNKTGSLGNPINELKLFLEKSLKKLLRNSGI